MHGGCGNSTFAVFYANQNKTQGGKATFGVFILHVGQFWLWKDFWKKFNAFADMPTAKMVLCVFAATLAIYLGFSLISIGRIYLFKLLHINKAVDYISELPNKLKKKK